MLAALKRRFRRGRGPSCELAHLPEGGPARARGKAAPKSAMLHAPASGRPCVYYQLDVYEWQNGSKSLLLVDESSELFKLDDATGSVLVDARGCDADLPRHRLRAHMSYKAEYQPALKAVLARHDIGMVDEYGELRSLEFIERLVVAGDPLEIDGVIRQDIDPSAPSGYRDMPQAKVLASASQRPLLLLQT